MGITYRAIGIIHTPFRDRKKTPYQYFVDNAEGTIEIFPEYEEGLEGIENFDRIIVLFHFHEQREVVLKVKPKISDEIRGVFSTRSPTRPNPIGMSVVKLLERNGRFLKVMNVDMLDGTPLLDIKPWIDTKNI